MHRVRLVLACVALTAVGCRSNPCDLDAEALAAPWSALVSSAPLGKGDGVCKASEKLEILFTKTEVDALDAKLLTWLEGQGYYEATIRRDRSGHPKSRRFGRESTALDLAYEHDRDHEGVRVTFTMRELPEPARSLEQTRAREQHAITVAGAAVAALAGVAEDADDRACPPDLFASASREQRPQAVLDIAELARVHAKAEPSIEDQATRHGTISVCDDLPLPEDGSRHRFVMGSQLTSCEQELNDRDHLVLFRLDGKLDAQAGILDQRGTFAGGSVRGRLFIYAPGDDRVICHAAVKATSSGEIAVTETIDSRNDRSLGTNSEGALRNDLYARTLQAQRSTLARMAPALGDAIRWPQ